MSAPSTRAALDARRVRFPGWLWRESRGSQLAELAIALPIVLIFLAGIADFATAFNTRQILNTAAREGARLGASESPLDLYAGGAPPSITAIHDVVQNYLANGGLQNTNALIGPCLLDTGPTQANLAFTYTSSACPRVSLVIDRGYTSLSSDGVTTLEGTHVTITYPYTWFLRRVFTRGSVRFWPTTLTSDAIALNTP